VKLNYKRTFLIAMMMPTIHCTCRNLQDQGIGGTVVLRLTVSADGTVTNVDIAGSSGISQLDKAAVKAAYTYSFAPARNVYDEPVMCIMNKKVVFVP